MSFRGGRHQAERVGAQEIVRSMFADMPSSPSPQWPTEEKFVSSDSTTPGPKLLEGRANTVCSYSCMFDMWTLAELCALQVQEENTDNVNYRAIQIFRTVSYYPCQHYNDLIGGSC